MEVENPSFMDEKDLVVFPPSKVTNEEEYFIWGQKTFNENNTKNPNKRRLVITTMSTEPILIEIRPNLPEPIIHPLMTNSTQCDIFERDCQCNRILCLEHMNLWNELYQIIHDSNTLKFSEESWFKQDIVKDSFLNTKNRINCRELWPNISAEALDNIKYLKKEIKKEKEEKENYFLALKKFSDLEEQLEIEKDMRNQESHTLQAVILELRNQVTKQAEEIRRLWTENLATEDDNVNLKLDENIHQEDTLETKKRIIELEHQLAEEFKQYKTTLTSQEVKCELLQSKVDELEEKQVATLLDKNECNNLKLKIEELEKEKLQYQKEGSLSIFNKDGDENMLDYATLMKEHNILKEELEKVNNNYNRTTNKLRHNVAKRRRLEAQSEGEKQQRSNLAAALYELESEVEATVLIINSLQSTTLESMSALITDLQKLQEAFGKCVDFDNSATKSSLHNDNEILKSANSINEQSHLQNLEVMNSNEDIFKGIPDTRSIVLKLTQRNEKILSEICSARTAIRQALKTQKRQVSIDGKELITKLETMEAEKETFRWKTKVLDEENKSLEEENSKLQHEVSSLKYTKSKLTLESKDLEKELEDSQENLKNLREENRRLLKEAKWKSVGKQGGYQESLIVQEWEKKLKKLEGDYEILRRVKKDLVKDKHHLEDELDRAVQKGYKGSGGSEDQKLEDELFNMTQERNKLRKIKITLAIENVSLKESLAELRTTADALETECETLREWKEKVQKLEEDCEDLRDWKNKAEALEVECEDLRDNQMKVEANEIECKVKKNYKEEELGKECKRLHESIQDIEEYEHICHSKDFLEEESKKLRECKDHLEEEIQKLHQHVDQLNKECNTLGKLKEKIENSNGSNDLLNGDELKVEFLEPEKSSGDRSKVEVEVKNKILHQSNSMNVDHCSIQEYLEKIAMLEQENVKLCESHQATLDKQWDVLQVDLKAFESKVEELENECESIRRDHLSSMVENAELTREKDKLLTLYNEQKYNYEILETANECLQKDQEQKEAQRIREQNDYHASIDNLNRQVLELESTFSERLHQQTTNYASCLEPKTKINGRETITLTRQEYEILLAEKAVMLQERDSAHKKLCSAEVQNLQLSASIECLRQEVPRENQHYNEKEINAEVLLAQDVINLRSMLNSLEEELETANCERNKMLEVNTSLRRELNELHEVLSQCQHENQSLNVALEELKRRSSLEQIHSAASSLKEQLGKASKEKDLIKEQLNKVIKEKEKLASVANERDNVIFSLREQITKLEKEREEFCSSFKIQLQDIEDNVPIVFHVQNQFMTIVRERDHVKEELVVLQRELESLNTKMSLVDNDLMMKTNLWQKEQDNLEEKCRRIEVELDNTKEALTMTKKTMQDDIQEAIKEKNNFELVAKKEIKDAHTKASWLHDELLKTKKFLSEKNEFASKEMDNITLEKKILAQKLMELEEKLSLLQKENDSLVSELAQCSMHTKDLVLPNFVVTELNQFSPSIQETLVEKNTSAELQRKELKFEIKEGIHLVHETTFILNKQKDELEALKKERDSLLETISKLKIEKDVQRYHKDTCSCDCDLVQVSKCESKTDLCFTSKEEQASGIFEKKMNSCIEFDILLSDKEKLLTSEASLKHQLADPEEKDFNKNTLIYEKIALLKDRDDLILEITLLKKEKEEIENKLERVSMQNIALSHDFKNKLATSEHDLYAKQEQHTNIIKNYARLKEENVVLVQNKNDLTKKYNNLIIEIAIVKKDNGELKEKLTDELDKLLSLKSKLSKSTSEKDGLAALELSLIQQINMLKDKVSTQDQQETKLQGEITVLSQTIETLVEDNDKLVKKCKKHVEVQYEISSLLRAKETLAKECDSLCKEITMLKHEKEISAKEYAAISLEKDHIAASALSLKNEVEILNKTSFSLNEHVVDLIAKNEKLRIELQTITYVEAIMSKVEEQQTCATTTSNTIEVGILCNMEQYVNQLNVKFNKESEQPSMVLSPITTTLPNAKLESLYKQLEFLKQHYNEIIKERDNLATTLKEKDQVFSCYKMEMETLKQKIDLLGKQQVQLVQERDHMSHENKSLQLQCDNLQAEAQISALEAEGDINSSAESKVTKPMVFKERSPKHEITSLQISVNTLKEQQTYLSKENKEIALENEALTKDRDGLLASISLLKKKHEAILIEELKMKGITTSEASLKKQFEELVQIMDALNKSQEGNALEIELMTQTVESLENKQDNILETVTPLNKELSPCLNVEHHLHKQVDPLVFIKKEERSKLQASLRDKLDDLAKTTSSLTEKFVASTKEREHLISEITSLQRKCQKLHMAVVISERDKDTLMKRVVESRSTFDCLVGEVNRLQRELADVEMRLGRSIAERDNANLQIAELQRLLSNQQKVQHLQVPYSIETVKNLDAENRCLRMEKDVLEECLNKRSMELEGNHRFQQQLPSTTNFNCMNLHPPASPLLHTSSQLYLSGHNPLGRPRPPLLPMFHQQWPM